MTREKPQSLEEFGIKPEGLTEEESKELRQLKEELYEKLGVPPEFFESADAYSTLTEEEEKQLDEKFKEDPKIAQKVARLLELKEKSKLLELVSEKEKLDRELDETERKLLKKSK